MLAGVEAMHSNKIYHRDIKLENILVDEDGKELRFIDFGLVDFNRISPDSSDDDNGTWPYMAPDYLSGRKYRDRMDIYALGICLYAMVCGELPFYIASFKDKTYKAFKNNGVDALPCLGDEVHVSKELKGLIGAMLAPDSKKRPSIKEIR